jgi:hypothetical protein
MPAPAFFGEIPRGLEDMAGYVLTGDVAGAKVDAPGARGLNWTIESDSDQLQGDNQIIAVVRNPKRLTGSVEVGRTNLAFFSCVVGGTATTGGSSPNTIITLDETASAGSRYFQLKGNTFSQDASGTGYEATLKKLLVVGGPTESLTVNEWSTPTFDFEGSAISGVLLTRKQYETYTALT